MKEKVRGSSKLGQIEWRIWQRTGKVLGIVSLRITNPELSEKHHYQTGTVLENYFGQCYLMHGSGFSIQLGCRASCEHPDIGHGLFQAMGCFLAKYLLIPSLESCYLENPEFSGGIEKTIPKNHSSVGVFNKVSKWIIFGGCKNLACRMNKGFIFICTLIYKSF